MSASVHFARRLRRSSSKAEAKVWHALRAHRLNDLHFRRQVPCGPYVADFLCHAARMVVEIDGATHSTEKEIAHDRRRDAWFSANGWRVVRFTNDEVYNNFEGVIETILLHLHTPSPALPRCAALAGEGADTSLHRADTTMPAVPSPTKWGRAREGARPTHKAKSGS
ncbi:MAG: DUF559 domain-containing protein [Beijerinckiaceae bacterium]